MAVQPCMAWIPIKKKYQEVFNRIGIQEKINGDDSTEIEKYVFAINGRKRLASVGKWCLKFLKKEG